VSVLHDTASSAQRRLVLLAGGWCAVRETLALRLARCPALEVRQAADVAELTGSLSRAALCVVVQDRHDDFACLETIRRAPGRRPIVVVAPLLDPVSYAHALALGAVGVVDLHLPLDRLVGCLEQALDERPLRAPEEVVDILLRGRREQERREAVRRRVESLTRREREVLQAIASGLPAPDAAAALFISPHTLRTHLGNILQKLDARSQLQAVLMAHAFGAVELGDLPGCRNRAASAR
jgi:DNA-binding NarL/FixJ family response regulator